MRFARSVSITLVSKGLVILTGIVTSILTARLLGPSGRGVLAVFLAITGIATQVGGLGLHAAPSYYISQDKSLLSRLVPLLMSYSLIAGSFLGTLFIIAFAAFPAFYSGMNWIFVLLAAITIIPSISVPLLQGLLLGVEDFVGYNAGELAYRVFYMIGIVIVLYLLKLHLHSALAMTSAAIFFNAAAFLFFLNRKGAKPALIFDTSLFKRIYSYGLRAYLVALLSYLVVRSDIFILNYLRGPSDTGIYSIAVQFADLIFVFPVTLSTMLFPKVASGFADAEFTVKVSRFTSFVLGGICILTYLSAKWIIPFMFSNQFLASVPALDLLLVGVYSYGMMSVISSYFGGKGMPLRTVLIWIPGLLLNVALNLILIPRIGVNGASISSTIAYFLIFILYAEYFRKETGKSPFDLVIPRRRDFRDISDLVRLKLASMNK
ncbi:MAG: flippase [Bacteroidetes bacterium]|nr:flippase [Bacteroidota bacterium]